MQRILAALFGVLLIAWTVPALAQDSAGEKLQAWESTLADVEHELAADPDLSQQRYGEILQAVSVLIADARALRAAEQQQTAPLHAQLNQLGAPPAQGAPPEDPDIAATRTRLTDEIGKSDARAKRAELAITRAQGIQDQIGQREQAMTQRKLAVRGPVPLLPATWRAAFSDPDLTYR
ncbi:MAG TPA: DUF3772 domain-containing protein, partial [Dongiaceae bacterium]